MELVLFVDCLMLREKLFLKFLKLIKRGILKLLMIPIELIIAIYLKNRKLDKSMLIIKLLKLNWKVKKD